MNTLAGKRLTGRRVLVVEDEGLVAEAIREHLLRLGCEIVGVVESGEEAVARALEQSPDLVLMDIHLAGDLDGIEAARAIHEHSRTPIVFTTAHSDEATVGRAVSTGPTGYVLKPFHHGQLVVALEMAIQRHDEEKLLHESNLSHASIVRSIGEAALIADRTGAIAHMNPAAERLTGRTLEEMSGEQLRDLLQLTDAPDAFALETVCERAVATSEPLRIPRCFLERHDGERVAVEGTVAPVLDWGDRPLGLVITLKDRTREEQALRALEESEARWQFALAGAGDGVWDFEPNSRKGFFSPRWKEILGHSEDEIGPDLHEWASRVHPADLPQVQAKLDAHLAGETPSFECEHRLRAKDGSYRWILSRGRVLARDAQGRALRFVGTSSDVTAAKQAALSLRESESRFRELVADLDIGVVVQNARDEIVLSNPAAQRMLGASESQLAGVSSRDPRWQFLSEDAKTIAADEFPSVVASRTLRPVRDRLIGACNLETGKRAWLLVSAIPRLDDRGELLHTLVSIVDVTSQRELERQLRHAQKLQEIGLLAGGVAHDFNNLLTVIRGYCDLLHQESIEGRAASTELIEPIQTAAEHASQLTQQLLIFSRRADIDPEVVSLAQLVRGLEMLLRRTIEESIEIELRTDADDVAVFADRSQLEQVVMNLCLNARDAMPHGGTLTVTTGRATPSVESSQLSLDADPPELACLTVGDTGCGMTPDVRERIFEPFFTTKEVGKGNGLGLATVYGVVSRVDGRLEVETEVGLGTTFRVLLPLADRDPATEEAPAARRRSRATGTVLVVEDQEQVRLAARRVLESHGLRVVEATDGLDALGILERGEHEPDLVLSDIVMPRMGGRELAERIWESRPRLPILLVSGYADDSLADDFRTSSPYRTLRKPWRMEDLIGAVQQMLDATGDTVSDSQSRDVPAAR